METELPRRAPPSRYKTVRRKPDIATGISVSIPPQVPRQRNLPPQLRQPRQREWLQQPQHVAPALHQTYHRPLVDTAAAPSFHDFPQQTINGQTNSGTAMRKIIQQSTTEKDRPPPPSTHPPSETHHQHKISENRMERVALPQQETDVIRKGQAREDAFAALEGKKKSPSKPKSPRMPVKYDLEIELHHDRKNVMKVPIHNNSDVEEVLQRIRPGHQRTIVECWPSLGIQRPVRYFEPLIDVMNTWDLQSSAFLRLDKNVWGESNRRLEEYSDSEPPSGEALFYYYITGDKKWTKRTISVEGGSVKIIKKDRPFDKDYFQSVSLENFDIYTFFEPFSPSSKLRCPTRFCFALKSQHKQSLFGKNSVFAHYFALENETALIQWFNIIRDVKARMIAEKRGLAPWKESSEDLQAANEAIPGCPDEGRRLPKPLLSPEELAQPASKIDLTRGKSLRNADKVSNPTPSGPGLPNSGDGFIPGGLLGAEYEEKRRLALIQFKQERVKDVLLQSKSTAMRNCIPAQSNLRDGSPTEPKPIEGGLLGSDYEEKKRLAMMQYKEERVKDVLLQSKSTAMRNCIPVQSNLRDVSPTEPTSRRPSAGSQCSNERPVLQRRGTTPSRPATACRPSTSGDNEQQLNTLISFGADEINANLPHHKPPLRGRSRTLSEKDAKESGGLIWLVPGARAEADPACLPPASLNRRPTVAKPKKLAASHEEEISPFTGRGLLAGNIQSAGSSMVGHGVKTGRDAISKNGEIRPLVGMNQKRVFAPGSLLERREREDGPAVPIIDRSAHDTDSDG